MSDSGIHIKNYDSPDPVTGREWSTEEAVAEFEFIGFAAPFVHVRRRSDGICGWMQFKHSPRIYFDFQAG